VCVYERVWQGHIVPSKKGKEHSQQAKRDGDILYTYILRLILLQHQIRTLASMTIQGESEACLQ